MSSSTVRASARPNITSSRRPGPTSRPARVHGPAAYQVAPAWVPFYVLSVCQYCVFQDGRLYWPCTQHRLSSANYLSHSHGKQHSTSYSGLALFSNACPQCQNLPKLPDHRFCSIDCWRSAAYSAPELKYLPPHHEMFIKIATQLIQCWRSAPRPKVLAVYMITWTESYQRSFEQYRNSVEDRGQFKGTGLYSGNEQKRFRSTIRACTLGEGGNVLPCHNQACWICETIRCGFEPHLQRKRDVPLNGPGIRLGAGIYTTQTSSKANEYAMNAHDPSSSIKGMLVCRVVVGKPYVTHQEDPTIRRPPSGYDCVVGTPGRKSAFADDEYVVYDADAIRAAYLVLYDVGRSGV